MSSAAINHRLHEFLAHGSRFVKAHPLLRRAFYDPAQRVLRPHFNSIEKLLYEAKRDKNVNISPPPVSDYHPAYPWTIGIIRDPYYNYESFILACRELKVAYRTIDLFAADWVRQVRLSACAAYVVWPSESIPEWKRLYDERLRFLTVEMGGFLYPPYGALWLYASKQCQHDWLEIHGFDHPRTWVFYEEADAIAFLRRADMPLVAKLDIGSSAQAIWILYTSAEAARLVRKAFRKGLFGKRMDRRARQWRHLLFQEYLPDIREWRMIRIGDSYFGHEKGKAGKFHSGSGVVGWYDPPRAALDLLHIITETGGFRSMAMDVFERPDGHLLVNELQSVFGAIDTAQMYINGVPGRYRRTDAGYQFEEGRFCRNACCNLRITDLLSLLKYRANHG